jgi:hypothetical protein
MLTHCNNDPLNDFLFWMSLLSLLGADIDAAKERKGEALAAYRKEVEAAGRAAAAARKQRTAAAAAAAGAEGRGAPGQLSAGGGRR